MEVVGIAMVSLRSPEGKSSNGHLLTDYFVKEKSRASGSEGEGEDEQWETA